MTERTLLHGGLIVSMDSGRTVGRGDVLIEDDRILDVGAVKACRVDTKIDCTDRIVIPGLIQPHIHLCQTLFRGRADGLELLDWLRQRIWPFEAAHTYASLFTSATLGAAELLRSGTTAVLDMGTVYHTEAIFDACAQIGLRATIGKAMMDDPEGLPGGLVESTEASLDESIRLGTRYHGSSGGRLRYAMTPRFVLCCTDGLMRRGAEAARERGWLLHTHASENPTELEVVRARCGMDNVQYLDQVGLSGSDVVLAHCVHLEDSEAKILEETATHVTHCPSSNLKLASGYAEIPELLERGINVGLSADGAPCNNNLDAFMEMRLAALIQKPRCGPTAMPAERVFEMATVNGAKALGLEDQIGRIEAGWKADVVVVDPTGLHAMPAEDPYGLLVYTLRGNDVQHVFVDGRRCVADGEVVGIDKSVLRQQCSSALAAMSITS